MEHIESVGKIYFTKEYARFRMIEGNRQLNKSKIDKIIREINNGNDMLRYSPIHVKESGDRLEILDGQHRYYIARHLGKPVYYVLVKEDKTMADIARVNSNVEKWKSTDFINCYLLQGNSNYQKLRDFLDAYGFNVGTSIQMLYKGNPEPSGGEFNKIKDDFQSGVFEVKYYNESLELAEDCKKFSEFIGWRDRSFVIAIYRIKQAGKISVDDLAGTYKKYPDVLLKRLSVKDYLYNLEQLFNTRKQTRTIII